jgi:hypothetical protein
LPPNGLADYYSLIGISGGTSGLGIACTTGAADADATALVAADEVQVNIFYN